VTAIRVVSLFSGVGGFDLGLERAGMTTVAQVEWDKKCQTVLARHWPDVPRWGDVSEVRGADLPDCDLVAFGSPCQDLSVAGKRAGMVEGETRSGLFHEAIRVIKEMQDDGRGPAWVVWENVVGALSSGKPKGADFGAVLDSMADLGAVDVEWRVLDAQFFGVPQRRRRVFVVARLDPRAAGADEVLPFPARVRRNPAKGREAGQDVAGTLGGGSGGRRWAPDTDRMTFVPDVANQLLARDAKGTPTRIDAGEGNLIPFVKAKRASSPDDDESWKPGEVAPTLNAFDNGGDSRATVVTVQEEAAEPVVAPTLTAYNLDSRSPQSEEATRIVGAVLDAQLEAAGGDLPPEGVLAFGRQEDRLAGTVYEDEVPSLTTSKTYAVAVDVYNQTTDGDVAHTIRDGHMTGMPHALTPDLAVRRLTPRECERLMGWPDDWTRWAADGSEVADSSRYRMCGNGVASPVAEWLGRCIVAAHEAVDA
jgi:DNA (cytosine-5)-methyltransferase 1